MATITNIEWTEATWNPVAGCTMVSPGCTNCYAQRMAARLQAMGMEKYVGTTRKSGKRHVWTGRVNFDASALMVPLTWKRPMRIFVNSMSDLFQEAIDPRFVERVWRLMEAANWHSFQILTKRPDLMIQTLVDRNLPVLPNVWLGASVESESFVERIHILRRVPASVRFISFEPLLGPIIDPDLTDIHWAIVGGESGPRARPMEPWWVEELRELLRPAGRRLFLQAMGRVAKKEDGASPSGPHLGRISEGVGLDLGMTSTPSTTLKRGRDLAQL